MSQAATSALSAIQDAVTGLLEPDRLARLLNASHLIETAEARVICTGMGKCWHIARKIAATLQSTGQPAVALHPGEAAHGDMGMIEVRNVVLALSNSGETDEVLRVARYALSRGCKLVVISSRAESELAKLAHVAVLIPAGPEGCPINRAPMASAAAMMAAGDAIAAELMARREFTEKQFLALHHGGYLGRQIRAVA